MNWCFCWGQELNYSSAASWRNMGWRSWGPQWSPSWPPKTDSFLLTSWWRLMRRLHPASLSSRWEAKRQEKNKIKMTAKRQMVHTSCINGVDRWSIWVCYSMCLHITWCNICFHPSGIWCLESSWADWLPSDVTISLCPGRFGLWSLCQQRKAGGNRPQGQKKGCAVWIGYPSRPSILLIYHRHNYHIADIHWQTLYVPSSLSMFCSL